MSKIKRLFWDIEVSPNVGLFWRSGYRISIPPENILHERAIMCICWKWEHEDDVYYLQWDKNQCDKEMIERFKDEINEADELVAHNGDKFDMKWFNGRCFHHKVQPTKIPKTVDTLVIARKRLLLNSNKLDYLARVLGISAKHDMRFEMWKKILIDKCKESMDKMVDYCANDVTILEKTYKALAPYHNPKTHAGAVAGREKWSCPSCGSEKVKVDGNKVTAAGTKQKQMKCRCCGRYYNISMKVHKDYQEWRDEQKEKKAK